jgi:hypothetical protein
MAQINSYYNVLIVYVCSCSKKQLDWCCLGISIFVASIASPHQSRKHHRTIYEQQSKPFANKTEILL